MVQQAGQKKDRRTAIAKVVDDPVAAALENALGAATEKGVGMLKVVEKNRRSYGPGQGQEEAHAKQLGAQGGRKCPKVAEEGESFSCCRSTLAFQPGHQQGNAKEDDEQGCETGRNVGVLEQPGAYACQGKAPPAAIGPAAPQQRQTEGEKERQEVAPEGNASVEGLTERRGHHCGGKAADAEPSPRDGTPAFILLEQQPSHPEDGKDGGRAGYCGGQADGKYSAAQERDCGSYCIDDQPFSAVPFRKVNGMLPLQHLKSVNAMGGL